MLDGDVCKQWVLLGPRDEAQGVHRSVLPTAEAIIEANDALARPNNYTRPVGYATVSNEPCEAGQPDCLAKYEVGRPCREPESCGVSRSSQPAGGASPWQAPALLVSYHARIRLLPLAG